MSFARVFDDDYPNKRTVSRELTPVFCAVFCGQKWQPLLVPRQRLSR